MAPLSVAVEKREGGDAVLLTGAINEDAGMKLLQLKRQLKGNARFNLKGITLVNSVGVRAWVSFMRDLRTAGTKVTFEECSPDIVRQLNVVPDFFLNADVMSIFGEYFCDSCSTLRMVLFPVRDTAELTGEGSDAQNCPECGNRMAFQDEVELYFNFVSYMHGKSPAA